MGSAIELSVFAAVFLSASVALAQPTTDPPPGRELEKRGYELYLQNKCDEAIPLFKTAAQVAPAPGTFVNLGRCEEKLNLLLAARGHFQAAMELATKRAMPSELLAQIDGMLTAVEQKIPRVKISIADGAPHGTIVKESEIEVPNAALAEGVAVDPGERTFVVSAAGREPRTFTVTLAEGQTQSLTVAPGPPLATVSRPLIEPPTNQPNKSPLKTVAVITMVAGAGALALGGVFGAIALGKKNDAEEAGCIDRQCPSGNAGNLRDDAKAAGTVSTIAFIGGGVLAAAGLGLFIVAPSASKDRVGLTLGGRF